MTSNNLVQWTLSIYFIGFAFGVFNWGRLSDRVGHKKAMIAGLFVAIAALFGSITSRKLTRYFHANTIIAIGCFIMLISSLILVILTSVDIIGPQNVMLSKN